MMRVLFGQAVEDFDAVSRDYRTAKRLLEASEQRRKSAEHGWVTSAAQLSDVQEAFDQLSAELRDTLVQLAKAKQEADMFKRALATVSERFLAHAPEYGEALS